MEITLNVETYITSTCKFIARDVDKSLPSIGRIFIEFLVGNNIDSKSTLKATEKYEDYSYDIKDGFFTYYKLEISKTSNGNNLYYNNNTLYYKGEEVTDFKELITQLELTNIGIYDAFYKDIFSYCKLEKCVIELQRKAIFDGLKNCNIGKCDSETKKQRDFLYISLVVVENLVCQKKFLEAETILDGITSCNSLCNDHKLLTNCNCNG